MSEESSLSVKFPSHGVSDKQSYRGIVSLLGKFADRHAALLTHDQKNSVAEIKRRLRQLENQYGELMNLNKRLMAAGGVSITFNPETDTVTFGVGDVKQMVILKRANPDCPIEASEATSLSAYTAGSTPIALEMEVDQMRLEELIESYYQGAHRVLKLVKLLPGLKNFECREITIVRNKLVEHPEGSEVYSFGYGSCGPVVRPMHTPGREWIDEGLILNTHNFINSLKAAFCET